MSTLCFLPGPWGHQELTEHVVSAPFWIECTATEPVRSVSWAHANITSLVAVTGTVALVCWDRPMSYCIEMTVIAPAGLSGLWEAEIQVGQDVWPG